MRASEGRENVKIHVGNDYLLMQCMESDDLMDR